MSKKTNPTSLRLVKNKKWASKSFFENYNYSKLLYQDLYIQDYIKNFLNYNLYGSIVHNISIQRRKFNIDIFVDYYQVEKYLQPRFTRPKKRKVSNIMRSRKVKLKKWLQSEHLKFQQKGISPSQKYTTRLLKVKKDINRHKTLVYNKNKYIWGKTVKRRIFKGQGRWGYDVKTPKKGIIWSLSLFSLRRLLILNLMYLTGCTVSIHTRNLAKSITFPLQEFLKPRYVSAFAKSYMNKRVSIPRLVNKLRIRRFVPRLKNFNVFKFAHLFYISIIFKNPYLLNFFLSKVLKKNIKIFNFFFNYLKRTLTSLFSFSSLNGIKLQFKGRLGTSLRKKVSVLSLGTMPSHTIDSSIEYSFIKIPTIYGICSIKIWYYY